VHFDDTYIVLIEISVLQTMIYCAAC